MPQRAHQNSKVGMEILAAQAKSRISRLWGWNACKNAVSTTLVTTERKMSGFEMTQEGETEWRTEAKLRNERLQGYLFKRGAINMRNRQDLPNYPRSLTYGLQKKLRHPSRRELKYAFGQWVSFKYSTNLCNNDQSVS